MKVLLATVAAAVLATPVLACGGHEWMGENLVATSRVKSQLRAAYLAGHPELAADRVSGPVAGLTYYGSYSGTRYAVATFTVGRSTAFPTIFRTDARGRWRVRRETAGRICLNVVPADLIRAWWLEWVGRSCYAIPRQATTSESEKT